MKIVELIESMAPGGGQRFVVDLINEIDPTHDVSLVTFRETKNAFFYKDELLPHINLVSYPGKKTIISKLTQVFAVICIIWKLKPDVVHAHLVAFNFIILPSFLFPKTKFYYTVHNLAEKDTGEGLIFRIKKWLFKGRIKTITISDICERSFERHFGFPSHRMIENGCREIFTTKLLQSTNEEIDALKRTAATKVYVNIARISEQKNHELLVSSFCDFVGSGHDAILLIIGDYKNQPERKQKLDAMVNTDRIYFLGTRHNVSDYLAIADYFVLSSSWEGLPISLLEAGFSGTYPISTPVGGVPDVIRSEEWGLLSRNLSIEAFSETLKRSFQTNIDRETLKHLYRSRFLMKKCANSHTAMFKECVGLAVFNETIKNSTV